MGLVVRNEQQSMGRSSIEVSGHRVIGTAGYTSDRHLVESCRHGIWSKRRFTSPASN